MTHSEIRTKSNQCKNNLNSCIKQIENYTQTINAFSKLKSYLSNCLNKSIKYEKLYLSFSIASAFVAIITSFFFLPTSIIILFCSAASFGRFTFHKKINKKFLHCIEFLSETIKNLTLKQQFYIHKKYHTLEEIIMLENTIPETTKHTEHENIIFNENNIEEILL